MPQQKFCEINFARCFPPTARSLPACPVWAATPLMQLLLSPSIVRCRSSKPTSRACFRVFLICKSQSIDAPDKMRCGAQHKCFSRNARGRIHNSALLDLGATVCRARNPQCPACPVRSFCRAEDVSLLPIKKKPSREKRLIEFHSFNRARGRILLEQSRKRWRGLWILPSLQKQPADESAVYVSEFPFTNHRVTLSVFASLPGMRLRKAQRWFPIRNLNSIAIPSPHRRAIHHLLSST